jgi:hypothetical protein
MKLYYTESKNIYDKEEFINFKEWINENSTYVSSFNLTLLKNLVNTMDEFIILPEDENIELKKNILREYIIYNSFTNFKNYIISDIPKSHEEILDLFSSKFEFLNKKKYNIILLNEDTDEKNTYICCSKFYNSKYEIDLLKPFVFILRKDTNIYEPIVYLEYLKTGISEVKKFYYLENPNIKRIVDIYINNCNILTIKNYINPRKLVLIIKSFINLDIKYLVINTSYKSVGFILDNNLFIPFNTFNSIYTTKYKFIYLQDIYKLKVIFPKTITTTILKIKYLTDIYENFNTLLVSKDNELTGSYKYYNIYEVIESADNIEALLLQIKPDINSNFNKILIPINISHSADSASASRSDSRTTATNELFDKILKLSEINNEIFINYQYMNEERLYNKLNNISIINKTLLKIVNYIISKPEIYKEINHIKHPLNPLNQNQKLLLIELKVKEIIKNKVDSHIDLEFNSPDSLSLHEKLDLDSSLSTMANDIIFNISKELLYKELSSIIKFNELQMNLEPGEISFTQQDIFDNKLTMIIESINNPLKTIFNSIEDSIDYIDIKVNTKTKSWVNIISDNYIEEITPTTPWGNYMKGTYQINIANDYNNEYLLLLFKKIGNLKIGNKLNIQILKNYLYNKRLNDYINDEDEFLSIQNNNISFNNLFKKLKNRDWENIKTIYDNESYYYSLYEFITLAQFIKINIVIIGRKGINGYLPNGIIYYNNNSSFYLLFHISFNYEEKGYNKIQLIMKDKSKILLTQNDILISNPRFWKKIEDNIIDNIGLI